MKIKFYRMRIGEVEQVSDCSACFPDDTHVLGSHLLDQHWQCSSPEHKVTMGFNINGYVGKSATRIPSL